MRFSQRILIAAIVATAMVVSAAPAKSHVNGSTMNIVIPESKSYGGAWPVTVTHSQFSNGVGCLTLTGGARGGSASLVFGGQAYHYGSFVVVNQLLMATIIKPSGSQNGALTFTAPASHGRIGQGLYEDIQDGSNFDFGALAFGMNGGC